VSGAPFDAAAVGRRVLAAEAEALARLAGEIDGAFSRAVECVAHLKGRLVCTGIGKSGHVARKIAATLASTGSPALFVHATEAIHGDLGMVTRDDAILALSKSGRNGELDEIAAYARRFGIPLIAITAAPASPLGKAADIVLALPHVSEAAEALDAPTTSTTMQMALGDALAVALLERRGFTAADFRTFHPGGKLGAALTASSALMHGPRELPLVGPDAPMREALLVMTERRFGCVGVVAADGRLAGIITDGDLRRHMEGLLDHRAGEVMTRHPKTIGPHTLAAEALKCMNEPPLVTVLFVVEDGRPVGILHVHDLLRAGVA
jgi:arabinose-5-phosphate isomerase